MNRTLNALALAILAFGPSAVANAQQPAEECLGRADVLAYLKEHYGEVSSAIGLTKEGNALEVTTSPEGTFSVLVTTPHGCVRIVTVGKGWETAPVGVQS